MERKERRTNEKGKEIYGCKAEGVRWGEDQLEFLARMS